MQWKPKAGGGNISYLLQAPYKNEIFIFDKIGKQPIFTIAFSTVLLYL